MKEKTHKSARHDEQQQNTYKSQPSARKGAFEVKLPAILRNYDRPANWPTNQPKDGQIWAGRKFSLPNIIEIRMQQEHKDKTTRKKKCSQETKKYNNK